MPKKVITILTALKCEVTLNGQEAYRITPPPYRQSDLLIPQDYIEEIARIFGYHNVKASLMATPIPTQNAPQDFTFELKLKHLLSGWGCQETYSYSMVSQEIASQSGIPLKNHLTIKNPYSSEMVYLRQSLLPSLAQILQNNPTYQGSLFELQNVYQPTKSSKLPREILTLSVITNQSYSVLKGLLDALFTRLHINTFAVVPHAVPTLFEKRTAAQISINNEVIGSIGKIKQSQSYGFSLQVYPLRSHANAYPRYLPVYTKPPVIEDLTFTLKPKTLIGPLLETVRNIDSAIIAVALKSTYQQNVTLTITYRLQKATISQLQVSKIRSRIIHQLDKQFLAKLVGSIA
jgi:phenylalanyl-tRNA synthetase beta chain